MTKSTANTAAIKAAAREWWVRLDSDEASSQDRAEFSRWLAVDPRHGQAFDQLSRLWGELDTVKTMIAVPMNTHHEWNQQITVSHEPVEGLNSISPKKTLWRWQWGAQSLAMGCLAMWLFSPLALMLRADFHTGFGETRDIRLSDGSTAHLNSNTALAVRIDGDRRQLTLLQGEAWFEVSPDKSRPFQVHAEHGSITALGTAFNVRLRDKQAEVSVTQHSVAVEVERSGGEALHTVVGEGQQVSYNSQTGLGQPKNIDKHAVTAWQRGKLVFENRPLGEVVTELNRYHRGYLLINDADIADRRINGVFRTDQPLAVIDALETSLKLHSTRIGDYLILLHR